MQFQKFHPDAYEPDIGLAGESWVLYSRLRWTLLGEPVEVSLDVSAWVDDGWVGLLHLHEMLAAKGVTMLSGGPILPRDGGKPIKVVLLNLLWRDVPGLDRRAVVIGDGHPVAYLTGVQA
jgi:hypothetical protein